MASSKATPVAMTIAVDITATTKAQMETLLKHGVIQMELFTEKLCEIVHENVRYILRRNPVRAREIETGRNSKVEKIEKMVGERNLYLSEHPRAEVSTALSLVNEKIQKLKVSGFVSIDVTDRVLAVRIDERALKEESHLDGCYVIRSNLPLDQGCINECLNWISSFVHISCELWVSKSWYLCTADNTCNKFIFHCNCFPWHQCHQGTFFPFKGKGN